MRMRRFVLYTLLLVIFHRAAAQQATAVRETAAAREKTDPFLRDLLRGQASPALLHVLDHPDSFRYQLIYTRIDRDKDNRPHFHNYYFRVNPLEYYNPASTVKMPAGIPCPGKNGQSCPVRHRQGYAHVHRQCVQRSDNDVYR